MKIIVTVGTSLISNTRADYHGLDHQPYQETLFSEQANNGPQETKRQIQNLIANLVAKAKNGKPSVSTEIASLDKIDPTSTSVIHLICTETVLSRVCGEALKIHFGKRVASLTVVEGLRIDDAEQFEKNGVSNLMDTIQSIINQGKQEKYELNISGGYKALIPILTIMGQLYNLPLHYLYEDSNELISLKQQGLGVNWDLIVQYAAILKEPAKASGGDLVSLQNMGLMKKDNHELTVIGKILAKYIDEKDPPFASSTIGYMVEYKIWEHLLKNPPSGVRNIVHALKSINLTADNDLDDIDIWMEKDGHHGIAIEIKPITKTAKEIKKVLKRHYAIIQDRHLHIDAYWVVVYSFENNNEEKLKALHQGLNNGHLPFPVEIKHILLFRNTVDGSRNRFNQHEFWRSEITGLIDYSPTHLSSN